MKQIRILYKVASKNKTIKRKTCKVLLNKLKFYYLQFIDIKHIYLENYLNFIFKVKENSLYIFIYIYRERVEGKINVKDLK